MSLIAEVDATLPGRDYERRLYVWTCRRKACRRKEGSIRAFRGLRKPEASKQRPVKDDNSIKTKAEPAPAAPKAPVNLGESLFGVKPSSSTANPFATGSSLNGGNPYNPFSTVPRTSDSKHNDIESTTPASPSTALPETFAQKARLSAVEEEAASKPPHAAATKKPHGPPEPWPGQSSFPKPFPRSTIECESEYISRPPAVDPSPGGGVPISTDADGGDILADKSAFESTMDRTFQRFADRLAENPEQILRYEWRGQPLLYTKKDRIGKLLSPHPAAAAAAASASIDGKIKLAASSSSSSQAIFSARVPRCENCNAKREFEMQITPYAILELEKEDGEGEDGGEAVGLLDGMDWGTILVGACGEDCAEVGRKADEVGYVEEWVGVQWEELVAPSAGRR
jgi:pre-rRNA-processing protein TSR4